MEKGTHLPIRVESQACNSMCMDIFENRHSLDTIGIPDAYIWLLPNLASCNQSFIWV